MEGVLGLQPRVYPRRHLQRRLFFAQVGRRDSLLRLLFCRRLLLKLLRPLRLHLQQPLLRLLLHRGRSQLSLEQLLLLLPRGPNEVGWTTLEEAVGFRTPNGPISAPVGW